MKVIYGPTITVHRFIFCLLALFLISLILRKVKGPGEVYFTLNKGHSTTTTSSSDITELNPELVASGSLSLAPDHPNLLTYIRKNHLQAPPSPARTVNISGPLDPNVDKKVQQEISRFILNLLGNKTSGFFIECGANDGEWYSNTLMLELSLNWTGVLIEADPRPFKRLKERGRNAWLANLCLSADNTPKKINMLRNVRFEGVSFIPGLRQFIGNKSEYRRFESQCFPLYSILRAVGVAEVDYFSLDIEGAELTVLKTIPWDLITIKTLSIEVHPQYEESVKDYMTRVVGYRFMTFIKNAYSHDQIYAHPTFL